MQVLVIGGAGYIGSHTCKLLKKLGSSPVVYDNFSTGHQRFARFGALETGDIRDTERLANVMVKYKPDCVVHFAASAYVGESMRDPALYYSNNIIGSISVLEAMRMANIRRIVFSSTCATYGTPDVLPIVETSAQLPVNTYGFTKYAVEQALKDYRRAYGIESVVLRYFNAAGADREIEIGEWHDPETHLIPLCIAAALGEASCLYVYGDDYDTLDGSAVRDYVHVEDLADAHIRAIEFLVTKGTSGAFNLGTGIETSVLDVIRVVQEVTHQSVPTEVIARRPGDVAKLCASADLAKRELGWTPQIRSLEEIVSTAYNWHRKLKLLNN